MALQLKTAVTTNHQLPGQLVIDLASPVNESTFTLSSIRCVIL